MIAIKNVDKTRAQVLCVSCGQPLCDVFEMTDRETSLGFACVCRNGATEGVVSYLFAPDTALTDALLRAVLNAMYADGVRTVAVEYEPLAVYMRSKRYLNDPTSNQLQIADFFAKTVCKG